MVTSRELTVADNPAARRYEARVGSEVVGFIDYREAPGRMKLMHTPRSTRRSRARASGLNS